MAIFMHSIWNGSAVFGGGGIFVLTYLIVMVPAFIIILVVISLALRREGQVVREFLVIDLASWILNSGRVQAARFDHRKNGFFVQRTHYKRR